MNKLILTLLILFALPLCSSAELITDDFADSTLKNLIFEKPESCLNYDFTNTERLTIKLLSLDEIKSETKVYEGMPLNFRVETSVYYNGALVIPKGTVVPARVETIIRSGMNGIPASIIIGGFKFDNIAKIQISDYHEIVGEDRSLWVFPLKWLLTPLPPTGTLTNFIKGGHAKLRKNGIIEIYYYPNILKQVPDDTDVI